MIITVANEKGGVAKTTTAVHIAHGLSRQDAQVLLIDLDAQGNCALHLGHDPAPGIFDLYCNDTPLRSVVRSASRNDRPRPGLEWVPGNSYTKTAQREADRSGYPLDYLLRKIQDHTTLYDYVVIDTHPGGYFQEVACWMADILVIPTALDLLSVDAVLSVLETGTAVRSDPGPLPTHVLPVFQDSTNDSRWNLSILVERFGDMIAQPVPRRVAAREAVAYGLTLFEHSPGNDAATAYNALNRRITISDEELLFS